MKTLFYTITFCISLSAFAQKTTYPDGIYMSLDQLKNKKPALHSKLEVIKDSKTFRSKNYKLTAKDETITKKIIKKEIYAYVQNDSLFINCFHHKLGFEYALAISDGPFIVFSIYGHDQSLTSSMGITLD